MYVLRDPFADAFAQLRRSYGLALTFYRLARSSFVALYFLFVLAHRRPMDWSWYWSDEDKGRRCDSTMITRHVYCIRLAAH